MADFARRTDLEDGAFAAAGALNVIEHVADPRAFLDELVRVVRPGGLVVICSPNLTSPLVGARILVDLARGRTPYLGVRGRRAALALLARNVGRSAAAALGRDAFAPRASTRSRPGWSATTPTRSIGATPPRCAAGWSGSAAS